MKEIVLGSIVKDKVTQLSGTATSRAVHLHGCDRYWIQPTVDKDGKPRDGQWVDSQAIEVIEEPAIAPQRRVNGGFNSSVK